MEALGVVHDPRREVEKIRDHLGSRDGRLAFLIGAGASAAVIEKGGNAPLIPVVETLTERCKEAATALGAKQGEAYEVILAESAAKLAELAKTEEVAARKANVEDLLSSLRTKIGAIGDGDRIAGLGPAELHALEDVITSTIAKAAHPDEDRIPSELPHHALARWIARAGRECAVELFTTNYDTLLERALEDERVQLFDGFVGARRPFFTSVSLSRARSMPGAEWTRLWKLHGSINWDTTRFADDSTRVVRLEEGEQGNLIFPSSRKYDESRKQPYASMLEHLGRVLDHPDGTVLVTLGYSFGDQHINEIVFDALDGRDRTHVFAMQYVDPATDHQLVARARSRPNLVVYGPDTAIIGGVPGSWQLSSEVEEATAGLIDVAFDSHAQPDLEKAALAGEFRLGDFRRFGQFLDTLTGAND